MGAIAIKGYSIFPKAPALLKTYHHIRTLVMGVLPLCRGAVGVFYCLSRVGHRTFVRGVLSLCRDAVGVFCDPVDWTTRHSLRESYPFPEMQSVYSSAQVEWATGHSLGESYAFAEMQSVYSAAPVDLAIGHSWGGLTPFAEMQSMYSAAPVDCADFYGVSYSGLVLNLAKLGK